jgi:hypothetical protein
MLLTTGGPQHSYDAKCSSTSDVVGVVLDFRQDFIQFSINGT